MTSTDTNATQSTIPEVSNANQLDTVPDRVPTASTLETSVEDKASNVNTPLSDATTRSKKELKRERKLQKRQKMHAEWKLQRKLKNKERKARKMLSSGLQKPMEKPKITPMAQSTNKFSVVIDFSYDELMSPKDLIKCGNQVVRCYSANRRSSNPMQLHFCNFTGKIQEEMSKNYEYKKWDIHFHEEPYLDVFNKSDLVYLTSESRNVLETLEENKVYIVGGLVDHNAHKGVSYRKAVLEGIAHAQLPIRKYIQMKSRSVLTINHVFEILLKVSNGEPWPKALIGAVPQRFFNINAAPTDASSDAKVSDDEESSGNIFEVVAAESTPEARTEMVTD